MEEISGIQRGKKLLSDIVIVLVHIKGDNWTRG
jgi:hypothetical protein